MEYGPEDDWYADEAEADAIAQMEAEAEAEALAAWYEIEMDYENEIYADNLKWIEEEIRKRVRKGSQCGLGDNGMFIVRPNPKVQIKFYTTFENEAVIAFWKNTEYWSSEEYRVKYEDFERLINLTMDLIEP